MKLSPDLIYEAALDDDVFSELPKIIVTEVDARSCVLHWRDQSGSAEIFTHSGYFSDGQLADYASNFVAHDLWTHAGTAQGFVNKAWRTSDLVASDHYQSSIFYNEWIRRMGDDTFYCCGSVMRTENGDGIIGLHRGRTQEDFSPEVLDRLNRHVGHLRRMFAIRGRIAGLSGRNDLLSAIFSARREAAFTVNASGRILLSNAAAEAALRSGRFLRSRGSELRAACDASRNEFDAALSAATSPGGRSASSCLLRSVDGGFAIASIMPLTMATREPVALVTLDEVTSRSGAAASAHHLQRVFGLSPSEADIAIRLAAGATLPEIADLRRSSVGTVRTQVKSILSKMDARRQSDIVRIVGSLPAANPAR